MPERLGDELRARFGGLFRRPGSRSSSPSPGVRDGSENDSTLQTTALEEQPSVHGRPDSRPERSRPSLFTFRSRRRGQPQNEQESSQQGEENPPTAEIYGLFTFGDKQPSGDYKIDIVAVHGLGGHWQKTWTDSNNGKLWLRDFLPSELPYARIMSYGYNSETVFSSSVTDIRDEAVMLLDRLRGERRYARTRPLIFICHSLGGIVMKKALILAHERSNVYGDLLQSVQGSMFFGVPHRGSSSADWGSLVASIAGIVQLGTNTNFINALKKDSKPLDEISQQFVERATQLRIRTFYETIPLHGSLIVKRDSALLNLANEIAVGIPDADHRTICKFGDASSQKYSLVKNAIWDLSDSAVSDTDFSIAPRAAAPPDDVFPATMPLSEDEIKCLRFLYTSDYNSHRERVPDVVEGTCTWFLKHEKFMSWREEQGSSLLWVSADPGCGKSVLSSFLVRKLRDTESQATVCYFFFKDDNDEQKSATSALCALLHQLFTAKNSLIHHTMAEFRNKDRKFTEEFYTLWSILTRAATGTGTGNVICVIDGLDECEGSTRSLLIGSLVKFYRGNPDRSKNRLKIIATSRPYKTILDGFSDLPRIRLKAENEIDAVSTDIELVINYRVQKLGSRRNLPDDIRTNLQQTLIKNADRTFLWVSLILGILEDSPEASENEFDEIMDNIPTDLDAIYEKILGRSKDPAKAKRILHIVVAAARPLTLDEMNTALAIRPGHKSTKDLKPNLMPSVEIAVKELCGLFVRVIDSKIYLVHQTAKEFLVDERASSPIPGAWKHSLCPIESNFVIANICSCYLLFTDFDNDPLVLSSEGSRQIREEVDDYTSKHTFLDYSAKHWGAHFRDTESKGESEFCECALKVYSSESKRFMTWFQVYWTTLGYQEGCPESLTELMAASYFGHEVVVQLLLNRGGDVNERSDKYGGALNFAALGKQRGTVQLLLDKGANFYMYGQGFTDIRQASEPF